MTFIKFMIAAAVPLILTGCGGTTADCARQDMSWRWMLEGNPGRAGDSGWVTEHKLYPTDGEGGFLSVEGAGAGEEMLCSFEGRRPAVSLLQAEDCFMFTVPAEGIRDGSFIELDATFGTDADAPSHYRFEYMDRTGWKSTGVSCSGSGDISTGAGAADTYQYTTVLGTFRVGSLPDDGLLKIRCVASDEDALKGGGTIVFADFGFVAAEIKDLGTKVPDDTLRVLMLGNSFTYFYGSPFMLKEIAWKEGLALDIRTNLKGGQTFGDHLSLSLSEKAVKEGGYDFAILQDQSQNPARFCADSVKYRTVMDNFIRLAALIREYSPDCRIILDRTWAYDGAGHGGFGDYGSFDKMLADGTSMLAGAVDRVITAPVGEAFTECRERYPEICLYYDDAKHPSEAGAYLKACVEYAVLTGKDFGPAPADCWLPEETASRLRSIARDVVIR